MSANRRRRARARTVPVMPEPSRGRALAELRRSHAAGVHVKRRTRAETERAALRYALI